MAAYLLQAGLQGFLLGISTGPFCLTTCAPALVPLIISEKRSIHRIALTLGELAFGRLLAYLLIGLAIGYAGAKLNGPWLEKAAGIAMISLSAAMLLFTATRKMHHPRLCRFNNKYFKLPVVFGFLTGINMCPPFLLAISSAVSMGSLWGSTLLFGGFFVGTTIYLCLLIPLGLLGASESMRMIGMITAALSGLFFLILGIKYVI